MASHSRRLLGAESPTRIPLGVSMSDVTREREKAVSRYVFVLDLARHMGRTGCAVAEMARRMKMPLVYLRREGTGKSALAVTTEDAKRLMAHDTPRGEIVTPEDLLKEAGA